MKCPICGRENPDIRLFCMQCGELLPETEDGNAVAAQSAQSEDIYARPHEESAYTAPAHEIQVPEYAAAEETAPAEVYDVPEEMPYFAGKEAQAEIQDVPEEKGYCESGEADDGMEFYRQRQRARGIIEEAWPEEKSAAAHEQPATIFDQPYEAPQSDGNLYSRPAYEDAPRRPELNRRAPANGRANTYIPRRDAGMEPDDFFAVRGQVLPEYDEEPVEKPRRKRSREGNYEEHVHQSFAVRHMRGFVTLMLLAITVGIVLIWANTDSAQYTLAKADIAWKGEAYAQLAEEAYAIKDLSAAGYYYSAALRCDEGNLNYAIMAANCYIEGGYTTKALDAVRKCISITPQNADLYASLIQLYPDASEISSADRQLIRKGYELTGDSRLNIE